MKNFVMKFLYKYLLKPLLFLLDAEFVHENFISIGAFLSKYRTTKSITKSIYYFKNDKLRKEVDGLLFDNPIGLAAGFDYDGKAASIIPYIGFGFNTIGTVTAKPYEGNKRPRLGRLPKSKSLFVNKGFKSLGAVEVQKILRAQQFDLGIQGISVGSSNLPEIDTIQKAIDDYIYTFNIFKNENYVKYFELNISCPNTVFKEPFVDKNNFLKLLEEINKLDILQPIYTKMPNELPVNETLELCQIMVNTGIKGVILANLVKNRENEFLDRNELLKFEGKKGNFSGKPTAKNSLNLTREVKKNFGDKLTIISTGGIFDGKDAKERFDNGADLVQLISGMIFNGPNLISEINEYLTKN